MKIVHISLIVPDYKLNLYKSLENRSDLNFITIHGYEGKNVRPRDVGRGYLSNERYIKNLYLIYRGKVIIAYQCVFKELRKLDPDVVILQDGIKILSNYLIVLYCKVSKKKLIWYTHGKNFQANNSVFSKVVDKIRNKMLLMGNAIITYTDETKKLLLKKGLNNNNVFVAYNTLDFDELNKYYLTPNKNKLFEIQKEVGINNNQKLIIYVGRLVKGKRVSLFLNLMKELDRNKYIGIIIGDGPEKEKLINECNQLQITNVLFLGSKSLEDTSYYLLSSNLFFLPGMVGLAICHSFIFAVPFVTLEDSLHGPEIIYLKHKENGLILNLSNYIAEIKKLLEDDIRMKKYSTNARKFAKDNFSKEKQISGFLNAIFYVVNNSSVINVGKYNQ